MHQALMSPRLDHSLVTSRATLLPNHFDNGESVYRYATGHDLRRLLIILESSIKLCSKLLPY
jgi:hypothetical protein